MFRRERKYHKWATVILLVLLVGFGLSQVRIRSVDQYQRERKKLAEEILVLDDPVTSGNSVGEKNTPEPEDGALEQSQNKLASSDSRPDPSQAAKGAKGSAPLPTAGETPGQSQKSNSNVSKNTAKKNQGIPKSSGNSRSKTTKSPARSARPSTAASKSTASPKGTATPKAPVSKEFICSIAITCSSLQKHMDRADDSIKKYIPADGMLLPETSVKVKTGDTAYSILQKVCKAKDIALDADYTKGFASRYVRGIGHLYEKQAGDMSGWLYLVNGKLSGWGASRYQLKEGD